MKFNIPLATQYFSALDLNLAREKTQPSVFRAFIEDIDKLYREEVFIEESSDCHVVAQLCLNSHQLLLASSRQVLSGHPTTVFPLARTALESACYAYLISENREFGPVWLERHNSEQAGKKCRKAFGTAVADAATALGTHCDEGVGKAVSSLYQALIDFGAHPNARSIIDYQSDGGSVDGYDSLTLGGVFAYDDPLTLRSGLAYIETALIVAVISSWSLGDRHPLRRGASKKLHELYERKNALFDAMQKS